jgi:hypothetical protein
MQYFAPARKNPEDPKPRDPRRAALVGLIVIALLVCLGLFLTHVLRDLSRVQDCAMQGRTNCVPIDSTATH